MTVSEYLATYSILFAIVQYKGKNISHHYTKFYKFPTEVLNSTSFNITNYGAGKVIITITK